MEYRVLESVFKDADWKSMQLLKDGHDKIYDREQITLDKDVIIFNSETSILMYDIQDIQGIQLFYLSVEEILKQVQQDMATKVNE